MWKRDQTLSLFRRSSIHGRFSGFMLQHERLKFKLDTAEEHFRWRYMRAFGPSHSVGHDSLVAVTVKSKLTFL
jgi:hypothetical protein